MTDSYIRIAPSVYTNIEARRMLSRWGWLPALIIVGCIVAGLTDVRWLFMALILAMVVYPMLLTMAWLAIIAQPQMQLLSHPFTAVASDAGIDVAFYPFDIGGNDDENAATAALATVCLNKDTVADVTNLSTRWRIDMRPNDLKIKFLLIPHDSLGCVPQFFYHY